MSTYKKVTTLNSSDESSQSSSSTYMQVDTESTESEESTLSPVKKPSTRKLTKKLTPRKPPHSRTKASTKNKINKSSAKSKKKTSIQKKKPAVSTRALPFAKSNQNNSIKNRNSTMITSQITTRSMNTRNYSRNDQTTTSTSNTDLHASSTTNTSQPIPYENQLPKALIREFTKTEGRKRSEKQIPNSENYNYLSRGRLMVLNRLKALSLHIPDSKCRKTFQLLNNDIQQLQTNIDKGELKNIYQFSSVMFVEEVKTEYLLDQLKENNTLLINYGPKHYSSEEHATTNLCVPLLFRADSVHASVNLKSGLRATLQVQFECDKGIATPSKPKSEIVPMCHDFNDPLFMYVMKLVQDALEIHVKNPKTVPNFAANNHEGEWYPFDSMEKNKKFALNLKKSYEYLKGINKLSGSFTEYMYCYWNLRNHNVKDVRIVFIGGNLAIGPHTDTRHMNSSNNSVTLHLNAWNSSDYIPGNTSSGCWAAPSPSINYWNTDGFISGKFGELDCWFDKATFKFIFCQELEHVKKHVGYNAFSKAPCPALLQRIKSHNELEGDPEYDVKGYEYVKICRSRKKEKND